MRRAFLLRLFAIVLAVSGIFVAGRSHDARAGWPPPPGADMRDKANWPNDYNGRWNYISFIPDREATAGVLDPFDAKLGAAGMSIDRAWTHTIGRDEVRIAITDSGIEWDATDLVNKAWLNMGELKGAAMPQKPDGSPCGGTGALAGYDCNGDGIFNVADYRDDPRISPVVPGEPCFKEHDRTKPGGDRIKGDLNRNCILDPGDIILMFSDGKDDDGNGYTDDISGWDFYKNDNDPYDDTRYGHGTGEARDSTAEANNGSGDPGVCPNCRFIPLRVGDSFITDANEFAKAVVYAADNGAKVVQDALGTVNQSAFSKAAIDYAYSKGTIVVASMADENSRHHNMPATANHVLTVHSIRYDGNNPQNSQTYVAFDTCSNFGGHLSLSVSGTSCSSEATGRGSGIAGLLHSMALQENLTPPLNAEEAIQLMKMTADDIDVANSRGEKPIYYFSHAGFDQRFGYGRANALKGVEAIKAKLIPPEVDIVSPEWFAPIHADRTNGTIAIKGRVAASRAKAYDFKVQWAPGVQPEEKDYRDLVAPLTNVPPSKVSGGPDPLAQLDPRQIDTTHVADPDSPHGENTRSISIRIHAVAHYDNGDVHGDARRVVSISNEKNGVDKDLLPGFPMDLGASLEASPKLADIDGDGIRDIVVPDSAGKLHVLTTAGGAPREVSGFPYLTRLIDGLNADPSVEPTVPSYASAPAYKAGAQGGIDPQIAREAILQAPAVADLDGDGKAEIIFATFAGTIYVINAKGQDLPGWPKRLPLVPSCPHDPKAPQPDRCMDLKHGYARGTYGAPVIVDMDKDGKPEIVLSAFDGKIYVYKLDGTILKGFPVDLLSKRSDTPSRIMATPTVADLNGDGIPEIISGSNQQVGGGGAAGPVFVVDGRGNDAPGGPYLPNWPFVMTSLKLFPVVAEGIVASQAVADFDGDGRPDILVQGNGSKPLILKIDPGTQAKFEEPPFRLPVREDKPTDPGLDALSIFGEQSKAYSPDVMFPLFSQPSIGDMDGDGVPDVVVSGGSLTLAGALAGGGRRPDGPQQQLIAMWSGKTGKMMPGSPMVIEDYTFLVNHALADVSGDGYPEVITGSGGYFLHALDACGREAKSFPKFTNGWIAQTAAVGDIDGDAQKTLEVVVGTRDGHLFAWHTDGKATGNIQWESFHHDNANTGNLATKLDQGSTQRPASVIDCSEPVPPSTDTYDAGGCACKTTPATSDRSWMASLFGAIAITAFAVRRRRR